MSQINYKFQIKTNTTIAGEQYLTFEHEQLNESLLRDKSFDNEKIQAIS